MAQVAFLNPEDGYGLVVEQDSGSCATSVASTTDGGSTFSPPVPVTSWSCANGYSETSLTFDEAGDGFVYGPSLYVSHDGGQTWSSQTSSGTVLAVVPVGRSVWMVVTPCSGPTASNTCPLALDESSDGGRTWAASMTFPSVMAVGNESPPWLSLTWLVRASLSTAFLVVPTTGTAATVLSTFDGGRTWRRVLVPCLGGWGESLSEAFDHTLWLACGGQPSAGSQLKSVVRSFDGGETWVQGSTCPPLVTSTTYPPCAASNGLSGGYLSDLVALSGTTALTAGERNVVQVTHDGGKTWSPTNPPFGGDDGSGAFHFVNPQDGWVLVNPLGAGALWRTTDGGDQWSQVWVPPTPPSELIPALQTHNPMVTVSPSTNLINGERVEVRVTGFGIGGKVWLSECADAADVNDLGCGHQLPQQTLLVTDDTGSGSATFQVMSSAASKPYDDAEKDLAPCVDKCVLVATLGGGYGFAHALVHFAGGE